MSSLVDINTWYILVHLYPRSALLSNDFQILGVHTPLLSNSKSWMGVIVPDLFSAYPSGMLPQFQRPAFVEVLLAWADPAILFKIARPLLPLSCTGAVAPLFKANAKRIKLHITKFLILVPHEISNPLVWNINHNWMNIRICMVYKVLNV